MIIGQEAIELHKLAKLVESRGGFVLDLNTDCVSCMFPNDINPFTLQDSCNLAEFYYDEDETKPKYKMENKESRIVVNIEKDTSDERLSVQRLAKMTRRTSQRILFTIFILVQL